MATKVCHTPTSDVDFYPTLLEIAGVQPRPQQVLDGESLAPLLPRYQRAYLRRPDIESNNYSFLCLK